MDIYELITQLEALDVPAAGIRAALKKKGFNEEEIAEAVPTTKRATFASDYYDWLAEAPRTEEEATDFIKGESDYGETSKNVKNHLSHYLNIRELALRIWEAK